MHRTSSRTFASLGLIIAACGGQSVVNESAGDGGDKGGAAGGGDAGATGGAETGGGGATSGGTGATANGGTTSGTGAGGSSGTRGGAGGSGGTSGGAAGSSGTGAGGSGGTSVSSGTLPCDVLEEAGHRCVAAHSTVRALVSGYSGALYTVQNADGQTRDIGIVDGYADATAHEAFCNGGCVIRIIYDQSPAGNHLTEAPPGGAKPTPGRPASADRLKVAIDGHSAFGILFRPGEGYRAGCDACSYPAGGPSGLPVGDEPQTIYVVSSQRDLVNGCCFDYGNAETTANNDGNGAGEALYFGLGVIWGSGVEGGPWVMADLENGLFAGWENGQMDNISSNTPLAHDFVTAVLVGDTAERNGGKGRFALYGGDATSGALRTMYDGIRPERPGYVPMQKQGSVVLSVAGDNSDGDGGRFYEGVIATGAATKETIDALQVAIVAAGYGR